MTRPALLRFVAVILAAGAGAAVPASAQDRLFIGTGEIGSAGRFGERIGDAPAAVHGLFVDGGRIVVNGEVAFDTLTGRSAVVPGGQVLAGDPLRPRVFTYDGQTVASVRVDTGQLSPLISAQPAGFLADVSARYAPAAGLLFVQRGAAGAEGEIAVVDVARAMVVRSFAARWLGSTGWSVSADGRRLVVNAWTLNPTGAPGGLLLIDAVTGALLASQQPPESFGAFIDDRRFERTYLLGRYELAAFDDNVQRLGAFAVHSSCTQPTMAVSPHTGRLYVVYSAGGGEFYGQRVPTQYFLSVYDGATGRFVDSRDITAAAGVPAGANWCSSLPITVVTAPGPPRQLAASMTGRDLALSWTDGGGITAAYVLEVGLAPGQTAV
ncbi:MAG: hypothetical protein IT199_08090, partial [Solirubrobacterales bacterium]|nr:hypothetical protein [Solirubrobacterales bacterium]